MSVSHGFEIDLSPCEDELFARMKGACRRCIRKAQHEGVTIEVAEDLEFVDDYYAQLIDVFEKQGLSPTYGKGRVLGLIQQLGPTQQLLLLRARDAQGRCIASGIFPAFHRHMFFWGGASWRQHQQLRPNELLMWTAMLYWKQRGIRYFDMCGRGDYKRKYGSYPIEVPELILPRFRVLYGAREAVRIGFRARQRMIYQWRRLLKAA
jgi:hypothetical protein